jgi:hypothetical protein
MIVPPLRPQFCQETLHRESSLELLELSVMKQI